MNLRQALATAAAAVATLSTPTTAEPAKASQTFNPITPWNIHYDDDSCALRRGFGAGTRKVVFELRHFAPGESFTATVAAKFINAGQSTLKVRFVPDAEAFEVESAHSLRYSDGMEGVVWGSSFRTPLIAFDVRAPWPKAERDARESAIRGVEISGRISPSITLVTGEMHKPMTAMRGCLDELLTHWGLDATAQKTLSRGVRPVGQGAWAKIIQDNYPGDMIRQLKGGIVRLRLIVDVDGRAKSCHIQIPSQDPSFERAACAGMIKAARFEPALDATGKPIVSYFTSSVIYAIRQ